ncbi:uncharacterized protein [Watersipora subatra]|uniref:uncharacterized protein n=1 Tax=Watersipora subatra TaxID=2589382 RepID=UPI00355B2918
MKQWSERLSRLNRGHREKPNPRRPTTELNLDSADVMVLSDTSGLPYHSRQGGVKKPLAIALQTYCESFEKLETRYLEDGTDGVQLEPERVTPDSAPMTIGEELSITARHTSGEPVIDGSVKEGEDVILMCQFNSEPVYCSISVFQERTDAWNPQVVCVNRVISNEHKSDDEIIFSKQDAVCTAEMFEVTFTVTTNSPTRYQCLARFIGRGGDSDIAEYPLRIHYGPSDEDLQRLTWDLQSGNLNLNCFFDYNGAFDVVWYKITGNSRLKVSERKTLTLKAADYVDKSLPTAYQFVCIGTNTLNRNQQGEARFDVLITSGKKGISAKKVALYAMIPLFIVAATVVAVGVAKQYAHRKTTVNVKNQKQIEKGRRSTAVAISAATLGGQGRKITIKGSQKIRRSHLNKNVSHQ